MTVADLDFQTRSLRGGLWETCKSGLIRPAPTPNYRPVIPSLEYFIDFIDFWLMLKENNGRNEKTSKQAFEE